MNQHEKAWLAWFLACFISFMILETRAIRSNECEGTLSHATRRALGMKRSTFHKVIGTAGLSAFFAWFVVHVSTGYLTPDFMKLTPRD